MKKIKIICTILLIGISVLFHFMYQWFPCYITSAIFPVNESIWEHMKLLATPLFVVCFIEWIIYKARNEKVHNLLISYSLASVLSIILYLCIYLPIYSIIGNVAFVSIALLFIFYALIEYFSYRIMNGKYIKYGTTLSCIIIFLLYSVFIYLTYNPPIDKIFLDTQTNSYGIIK